MYLKISGSQVGNVMGILPGSSNRDYKSPAQTQNSEQHRKNSIQSKLATKIASRVASCFVPRDLMFQFTHIARAALFDQSLRCLRR